MFTNLLTQLLMLLSVFGLYSPQHPHSFQSQPAIVRPAPVTTNTVKAEIVTPVKTPAVVVVEEETVVAEQPAPEVPAVPVSVSPPTPAAAQTNLVSDTEAAVLAAMNTERTDAGLSTLSYDSVLGKIARAHSADMQTREYFNHADPEGCSSSCRADAAGYTWRAIGENIYFSSGYKLTADASAAMTVDGWMHSSGHRANILGEKFTHVGVGVAVSDEDVYITAVFAKPR